MKCYGVVEDGIVNLNYTAYVIFMQCLSGTLAKHLQLRASFFDAFGDIGSQQARSFLATKLRRAESDRAAQHLRSETDGPNSVLLTKVDASVQHLAIKVSELESALASRDGRMMEAMERQLVSIKTDISAFTQRPHFDLDVFKTWVMTEWGQALCTSLSQAVCFSLSQKFKDLRDEIREVLSNPTGSFIEALRKAVKLPAMRRTCNSDLYPEDQRVTADEERFAESPRRSAIVYSLNTGSSTWRRVKYLRGHLCPLKYFTQFGYRQASTEAKPRSVWALPVWQRS